MSERGFTLVEVAVAGALVSIGLLAMATIMERQNASVGSMQTQLSLRQVQNVAINLFLANPNSFPPVQVTAGGAGVPAPITYVGCFTNVGLLVANSKGSTQFLGVSKESDDLTNVVQWLPTGFCDNAGNLAQVEVHVQRQAKTVTFYSILLPPLNPGGPGVPTCPQLYPPPATTSPRNCLSPNYVAAAVKRVQDSIALN